MIVDKLSGSRFLAVLGRSGVGKSSLLRAGLVPELRRKGFGGVRMVHSRVFRPGPRPLTNLAAQMAQMFPQESMQATLGHMLDDERSLDLAACAALADGPETDRLLLVVDQFEEIFAPGVDDNERAGFLANLLYASTIPGGRVMVVIGIRADFYQLCDGHPALRVLLADHQVLVGPIDGEGLPEVIEGPARRVGLTIEPGLVETMIADVSQGTGGLPLLEHVLLEMWNIGRGEQTMNLEAYVAVGGVRGAVSQRANMAYRCLSPRQQAVARVVLLRLTQRGRGVADTRRRVPIVGLSGTAASTDVEAVVESLREHHLVTVGRDEVSGARVVEIAHEVLIKAWPELDSWIQTDRQQLRSLGHLIEAAGEWDCQGRQEADLYRGARLAAWKSAQTPDLTDLERAFLDESCRRDASEHLADRRRTRRFATTIGVVVAVALVASLLGLREVTRERNTSRSRELAAEATRMLPSDPDGAFRVAASAYELMPTREAEQGPARCRRGGNPFGCGTARP